VSGAENRPLCRVDAARVGAVVSKEAAVAEIDKYLKMAKQVDASDIHFAVGAPPMLRLHGILRKIKHPPFTAEDTERMLFEVLDEREREIIRKEQELYFSYETEGVGRCRVNVALQNRGWDGTFRIIPIDVGDLDQLGFPPVVKKLLDYRQGLILVTGQCGCGKTTTLAACCKYLNERRRDHIITLEDPIEIVHHSKKCHIIQREVGPHTESFARALRACLREDPDVIIVGEMRDLETISNAITAAETGHLVLGTLHTTNAHRTISRVLDVFPPSQQDQIRTMVADSLRGIVSQQLVPRADGKGRIVCTEVLVCTPAIANMIKEDKTFQIPSLMQTGVRLGMQLMDDALYKLLAQGLVTPETALARAYDPSKFRDLTARRKGQMDWIELKNMRDDKHKRRALVKNHIVLIDRKTKKAKPISKSRMPFLFYMSEFGKLPEDEIYAELCRLWPEIADVPEEHVVH
jgi:twitching motility protein PilT